MLARQGFNRRYLYNKIGTNYRYDLTKTVDQIRETYTFDETCQGTVPQTMVCAFDARDFEDAIRNAISIGGDSDTVAAITGSVAEAMFGIPEDIREKSLSYLPEDMMVVVDRFVDIIGPLNGKIEKMSPTNRGQKPTTPTSKYLR
jgi:ADP-ribosyl-[dinitrogen reductase] hydrolase